MNKEEINTISEEQLLHNKLSFEINTELIHLMKKIIELQQENEEQEECIKYWQDKYDEKVEAIDKAVEYINNCIGIEVKEELRKILKGDSNE